MSFKNKLLHIYARFDLNPTSLSRKLGYDKAEKIARLTRDDKNLPSYEILRDLIILFKEIDPYWWFVDEGELKVEEHEEKYGTCKECMKKEVIIEFLKKECTAKDKTIEELRKGTDMPGRAGGQAREGKKAS